LQESSLQSLVDIFSHGGPTEQPAARAGSFVIGAVAGLVALFGVWWAIGAVSPIPPPEGTPVWGVAFALLLMLPIPLGALYISARFIRRALRDEHRSQ